MVVAKTEYGEFLAFRPVYVKRSLNPVLKSVHDNRFDNAVNGYFPLHEILFVF